MKKSLHEISHMDGCHNMRITFDERKMADSGLHFHVEESGEVTLLVRLGAGPMFHEEYERFIRSELGEAALGELTDTVNAYHAGIALKASMI